MRDLVNSLSLLFVVGESHIDDSTSAFRGRYLRNCRSCLLCHLFTSDRVTGDEHAGIGHTTLVASDVTLLRRDNSCKEQSWE